MTQEFNSNTDRFTLWLCEDNMQFAFYTASLAISNQFVLNDTKIANRQLARNITPEQIFDILIQRLHNPDARRAELYQGSEYLFGFLLEETQDWNFNNIVNRLSKSKFRFNHCINVSELIRDFRLELPNLECIHINTGPSKNIWLQDLTLVDFAIDSQQDLNYNVQQLYNYFRIKRKDLILELTNKWIEEWNKTILF